MPIPAHIKVHIHVPSSPLAHQHSLLQGIKISMRSILAAILILPVVDE